jgi:hypothetical protein
MRAVHARPGRRARVLHTALATLSTPGPRSPAPTSEICFLALTAQLGLPRPRVNTLVEGYEVDFFWPEQRLIIETDGGATHATLTAFRNDRRRDLALKLAGYEEVRLTWADVVHHPDATARALSELLTRSR